MEGKLLCWNLGVMFSESHRGGFNIMSCSVCQRRFRVNGFRLFFFYIAVLQTKRKLSCTQYPKRKKNAPANLSTATFSLRWGPSCPWTPCRSHPLQAKSLDYSPACSAGVSHADVSRESHAILKHKLCIFSLLLRYCSYGLLPAKHEPMQCFTQCWTVVESNSNVFDRIADIYHLGLLGGTLAIPLFMFTEPEFDPRMFFNRLSAAAAFTEPVLTNLLP